MDILHKAESDSMHEIFDSEQSQSSQAKKKNTQDSPGSQTSSGNHVDLSKKSTMELLEMLERHKNILSKKALVGKLPDKGEKLKNIVDKIENELLLRSRHYGMDDVTSSLASVQLNEAIEWNVSEKNVDLSFEACPLNQSDPLLNFIEASKAESDGNRNFDPYVEALCKKYEIPCQSSIERKKFFPNKSTEVRTQNRTPKRTLTSDQSMHTVTQLKLKDSLMLQKKIETSRSTGFSILTSWRQMATIDSDTDEEDQVEVESQQDLQENDENPPELP